MGAYPLFCAHTLCPYPEPIGVTGIFGLHWAQSDSDQARKSQSRGVLEAGDTIGDLCTACQRNVIDSRGQSVAQDWEDAGSAIVTFVRLAVDNPQGHLQLATHLGEQHTVGPQSLHSPLHIVLAVHTPQQFRVLSSMPGRGRPRYFLASLQLRLRLHIQASE